MWGDITREPKRTNRFILVADGLEAFAVQDVTLPKMDVGEAKVDFVSHQFWYPGKVTWQDVTMTLVDAIDPNTSDMIMNIIRQAGYQFPVTDQLEVPELEAGSPYVTSFSKQLFNIATGEVGIRTIDFMGDGIDEWWLRNAWIKNVSPGDLTMADANILNIKLTFKYDWAEYRNLRA